jgi:hypothetical protein
MGNYLPRNNNNKSDQTFESCSSTDLEESLKRMGPLYEAYIPLLTKYQVSGKFFQDALKRPGLFSDLFDRLGIHQKLHRIVLESRIRNHHGNSVGPDDDDDNDDVTTANVSISQDSSNSPQDLVNVLAAIESYDNTDYANLYSHATFDHCLSVDILGKLRPLNQWKVVFEGLGVTDVLQQNIIYNAIMDVYHERAPPKQRKRKQPTTTEPVVLLVEESTEDALLEPTRKSARRPKASTKVAATTEDKNLAPAVADTAASPKASHHAEVKVAPSSARVHGSGSSRIGPIKAVLTDPIKSVRTLPTARARISTTRARGRAVLQMQ